MSVRIPVTSKQYYEKPLTSRTTPDPTTLPVLWAFTSSLAPPDPATAGSWVTRTENGEDIHYARIQVGGTGTGAAVELDPGLWHAWAKIDGTTEDPVIRTGILVVEDVDTSVVIPPDTSGTEFVQDTVGGMVTGNTETGIVVDYDDTTGKLNFAVSTDTIPKSLVDAKGDLLAGTANDTVARVAVGANGTSLEADSTATPGVAWVSRPRIGDRWKTGSYYSVGVFGATAGSLTPTLNKLYLSPFVVGTSATFDRIGISVATAVASSTLRLGIYSGTGGGYPNTVILDAGTVDSSTTGFKEITINQTLTPGVYWVGCVAQGGSPTFRTLASMSPYVADTVDVSNTLTGCYVQTGVTGALSAASPFSSSVNTEQNFPRVQLRAV